MSSAADIAASAPLRPITEVAATAGLQAGEFEPTGPFRGKVEPSVLARLRPRAEAKLVVVTAVTPTRPGEGKTTTSIALTMGLGRRGQPVMLCLREPSMGPVFGAKGGGTGGGAAQVAPMEAINLHFNGDLHAVTTAHNLLASALDASIFNGNPLGIDPASITWPRTLDLNDRELRYAVVGLGGKAHGIPREHQFIITAASEVMAVLALARDLFDLRARLGRIVVASTTSGDPVTAEMLRVAGAMTVVMKEALKPNLVQTLEGQPCLVHAGPFGNIAHGASSVLAARIGLACADYVVTEAGFGSDLGLQKFCDIVCPVGELTPHAAVLVTTVRATKAHGGIADRDLAIESRAALRDGSANLAAHVHIVRQYGLPCVVAINRFASDTPGELALLRDCALASGADTVVTHTGFADGGAGATDLADAVVAACARPRRFASPIAPGTPVRSQIETIATRLYGASGVAFDPQALADLAQVERLGLGTAPVCIAKTHLSLSHDPALRNRPSGFVLPVRRLVPNAGAGFVVGLCGDVQRMPGLGKAPAFTHIDIDTEGRTIGLS